MRNVENAPPSEDKSYFKLVLKGGKGYEDSWLNIGAGTVGEFRRAVAAFFGWTNDEELAELSPAALSFNATQEWHAMNNIGAGFPTARAIGGGAHDRAYASVAQGGGGQAELDPKEVLLAQIDAQESVVALKRLYGENKAQFEAEPELIAAYKAKGKALSANVNQ